MATPKNKSPSSKMIDPNTEYSRTTKSKEVKDWGEGMDQNYEGMSKDYERYKQSSDPSKKELTGRLKASSQDASDRLNRALNASDRAVRESQKEVKGKLEKASAPKPGQYDFKKGGTAKKKMACGGKAYAKGGLVKSSKAINGCAQRGLTKGRDR